MNFVFFKTHFHYSLIILLLAFEIYFTYLTFDLLLLFNVIRAKQSLLSRYLTRLAVTLIKKVSEQDP